MEQNIIRLIIAEDMRPIREKLKMLLEFESDIDVVDLVDTGKKAVDSAKRLHPDIMLIDIQMELADDGIDAIREIKLDMPDIKCIVLTAHNEESLIFDAVDAGAEDYILKDSSSVEIIKSIKMAYRDQASFGPEVMKKVKKEFIRLKRSEISLIETLRSVNNLTKSEFVVLKMLLEGKKQKEISRIRCVEPVTVRSQISNILKKTNSRSVNELIRYIKEVKLDKYFEQTDSE